MDIWCKLELLHKISAQKLEPVAENNHKNKHEANNRFDMNYMNY